MTGMEDALAAHMVIRAYHLKNSTVPILECACDHSGRTPKDRTFHLAEALAAAGFGNLHDAWAEGVRFAQNYDSIYPNDNPYPAKVSET